MFSMTSLLLEPIEINIDSFTIACVCISPNVSLADVIHTLTKFYFFVTLKVVLSK